MTRNFLLGAACVLGVAFPAFGTQSPFGDGAAAKALLVRAVAAIRADKTKALEAFNNGADGFWDRDLYPFCFNLNNGEVVATRSKEFLGLDARTFKDVNGKPFGKEIYRLGHQGDIGQTSVIMFPRPGADTSLFAKQVFVVGVGDIGCGVGYYK